MLQPKSEYFVEYDVPPEQEIISVRTSKDWLTTDSKLRERLADSLNYAFLKTYFYKRLFRKILKGREIVSDTISDYFCDLPFTSKEDVVQNYPDGFLAVERRAVVSYFESTGTTGNTIHSTKGASYFTAGDFKRDKARRFSPYMKLTADDVVINALPFALTSSGMGFQQAAMEAGAMVACVDNGSMLSSHVKHMELAKDLGATVWICSLPFVYSTLLQMEQRNPKEEFSQLRAIQLCGLPVLPGGRAKIEQIFGVPVFNTYGLSEFGATTYTCSSGHMHVFEDDFFFEIINPRDGKPVEDGSGGEVVVTTLTREASPKIRYRTGDFGIMSHGICSCGCKNPRIEVKGRLRDAAQFGERFRLPIDFEESIYAFPETTGLFSLTYAPFEGEARSDRHNLNVTLKIDVFNPNQHGLKERIERKLREEISPLISVDLVRVGDSHSGLLDQSKYANVRTVKSAMLNDRRPQEWLVTY